jgi:hypothetical protein
VIAQPYFYSATLEEPPSLGRVAKSHVCFTPESGHVRCNYRCPLWANSGHYTSFYSITSSALARSVGGTVRPSTLAVLRLRTNSNFVGCSTGGAATHTMLAPYDGAGIEVHILFEQKFVCNLDRAKLANGLQFSEQQPRPRFARLPAADRISALPLEEPDGSQN